MCYVACVFFFFSERGEGKKREGWVIIYIFLFFFFTFKKAQKFVNGEIIFKLIDDDNIEQVIHLLKTTIKVCTRFKDCFEDCEKKHVEDGWNCDQVFFFLNKPNEEIGEHLENYHCFFCLKKKTTVFCRLDAFLERCHDILWFKKIKT